jgi:protein disulfide-isomerase A1
MQFKHGNLQNYRRSEQVPLDNDLLPVKVLVGDNHDEVVHDEQKDVLVKYYSPDCHFSKKLGPALEELAMSVQGSDLVIGKFDSTMNEVEGLGIYSTPKVIFYGMNNEEGIIVENGRDIDVLKEFLKENSSAY